MKRSLSVTAAVLGLALGCGTVLAAPSHPDCPPGAQGHGWHHHPPGPMMMHRLHELGLSADQKAQVKKLMTASREQMRSQFESLRTARHAFDTAVPGTSAYTDAQNTLADAEADAARSRVGQEAGVRAQVYALLTDAQKAKWATVMSQPPMPPPPPPQG
jgi:Spy/CpxP family protein refolding chaperone